MPYLPHDKTRESAKVLRRLRVRCASMRRNSGPASGSQPAGLRESARFQLGASDAIFSHPMRSNAQLSRGFFSIDDCRSER